MIELIPVEKIENKKHIAILDTSSISFMQELDGKGIAADIVLQDYELLLIPNWVLTEINDAAGRKDYVYKLRDKGYPIYRIAEESYSELVNQEEGNLYQIVLASTYQIGRIKSYLRRFVEKSDILDMDAYQDWINKLYEEHEKGNINIENILDLFEDEITVNYLSGIMSSDFEITDVDKCIEDVLVTYRKELLLQRRNEILGKIDNSNLTKEEVANLEAQLNEVIIQLAKIK